MGYEKNPITSCELVLQYVAIHGKMYILPAKDSVFFWQVSKMHHNYIYIYTILHTKKGCFLIYCTYIYIYIHIVMVNWVIYIYVYSYIYIYSI